MVGEIYVTDFLTKLAGLYSTKGFTDTEVPIRLTRQVLESSGVPVNGSATLEQIAEAFITKIREVGGIDKASPWLQIGSQYLVDSGGVDLFIDRGIEPSSIQNLGARLESKRRMQYSQRTSKNVFPGRYCGFKYPQPIKHHNKT